MMVHTLNNLKFISKDTVRDFPMMLTKACVDPSSKVDQTLFYKVCLKVTKTMIPQEYVSSPKEIIIIHTYWSMKRRT